MAKYIDVDKLHEFNCESIDCSSVGCAECYYNNGGAEDVAPVIHSKWETSYFEDGYKVNMTCLNCGGHFSADYNDANLYNYCPNCGAKMDKGD